MTTVDAPDSQRQLTSADVLVASCSMMPASIAHVRVHSPPVSHANEDGQHMAIRDGSTIARLWQLVTNGSQ